MGYYFTLLGVSAILILNKMIEGIGCMLFRPKYTIDTIYHLDDQWLQDHRIQAVYTDLDNTLLAWNQFETAKQMDHLNKRLQSQGIKLVVISNNNAERVGKVLDPYGIPFVAKAKKPLPFAIKNEALKSGYDLNRVLYVGDQLITDMVAGNKSGVNTVLVKPLVATDKWNTRINRFFERIIFFFLNIRKRISFSKEIKAQ